LASYLRIILIFFCFVPVFTYGQAVSLTKEEKKFISEHPVIRLGGEPEWEPMIIQDHQRIKGLDRDLLDEVEQLTGLTFEIEPDSWNEVVAKAKNRQLDGLLYSSPEPERTKFFLFTDPYVNFQVCYYGELSDPYINSFNRIKGAHIAIQKGDQFSLNYLNQKGSVSIIEIEDRIDIVEAIISGEVDYYFGAMDMSYYLSSHGITTIKPIYYPADITFSAVYSIRNDYPELVSILNKAIAAIPSETRNQLLEKWNFVTQTGVLLNREFFNNVVVIIGGLALVTVFWIITIFRQMRKKKQVRDQLINEKAQLISQIENIPALIFSIDKDFILINRNYNFRLFIESTTDHSVKVGDNIESLLPSSIKEKWLSRFRKGLQGKKFSSEDTIKIDGEERNYITHINPIKIEDEIIGISCFAEDITQLTSLNQYMLQLMQSSHDFIFIKDRKLRYKIASQSFANLNGFDHWKELIGKTDEDLDPVNAKQYKETERKVINEGVFSLNKLHEFLDKEGNKRWVQSTNEPILDKNGSIIGLSGISRDVTLEKESERQQRMLVETIENSRDFVCLLDESFQFLYINDFGKQMVGIENPDTCNFLDLFETANKFEIEELLSDQVRSGKMRRIELPVKHLTMNLSIVLDHSFIRINDAKGDFICYGEVARDVTERIELSRQLIDISVNQKLMKSTLEAEENERSRIAKELHDGIQQKLAIAIISLQGSKSENQMQTIQILNESITDLRGMSHNLSPLLLEKNGLATVINDQITRLVDVTEIDISFFENIENKRFGDEIEINLYRIFQECISNCLKYAHAQHIQVQLILSGKHLTLMVEDDGVGFDTKLQSPGIGLNNIKNRVNLIKGHLEISSSPQNGTHILIETIV
jgi:PAS domain S-box-containing protein